MSAMTRIPVFVFVLLLVACAGTGGAKPTPYEQFGGKEGIDALVEEMLVRVLDDPRINGKFIDVDLLNLSQKLAEQFCVVLDGPCTYTGRSMAESHAWVKADAGDFNALVEALRGAMDARAVPRAAQNRLLSRLAAMQRDIVVP